MVTSRIKLDECVATWASLPALSTRQRSELDHCTVDRAIFFMCSLLTLWACRRPTCWADNFGASKSLGGTQESGTSGLMAVHSVLREDTELGVFGLKFRAQLAGNEGKYGGDCDRFLAATKWIERFVPVEQLNERSDALPAVIMLAGGM